MKRKLAIILMMAMVIGASFSMVGATTMNSTTSNSYTPVLSGTDTNGEYYFVQGSVLWNGSSSTWPSGAKIYYAPYTSSLTKAGSFVALGSVGASSGSIQYFSYYGHRSDYRVGSHTSSGYVDTTFSFYV